MHSGISLQYHFRAKVIVMVRVEMWLTGFAKCFPHSTPAPYMSYVKRKKEKKKFVFWFPFI